MTPLARRFSASLAATTSSADPVSFCTKVMKFSLLESSTVVGTFLEGLLRFFFSVVPLAGLELLKKPVLLLPPAMMSNGLCVCGCECV